MTTYTQRLFLGQLPSAWGPVFTATNVTTILRDIEISVPSPASPLIQLSIQAASGSPSAVFLILPSPTANSHFQWQGRLALNKGDALWANTGVTTVGAIITGYVFDS